MISATCSVVATYSACIIPVSLQSHMCLKCISMCFVLLLICPLLIRSNAPWLLIRMHVGSVSGMMRELNNSLIQITSLTTANAVMNSNSTMDNTTQLCFFDPHDTVPPSIKIADPLIDFLSKQSSTQSKSTYEMNGDPVKLLPQNSSL